MSAKRIHVQLFVRYLEDERKYKPAGEQHGWPAAAALRRLAS
jgi:hypothetical protein